MTFRISIDPKNVKVCHQPQIIHCSVCYKRIKYGDQYVDLGWGFVHLNCWQNWEP